MKRIVIALATGLTALVLLAGSARADEMDRTGRVDSQGWYHGRNYRERDRYERMRRQREEFRRRHFERYEGW